MSNGASAVAADGVVRRGRYLLAAVAGAAALAWAVGLYIEPKRGWASLLMVAFMLLSLALGAVCFVALQHVSGARWSVPVRRVAEAIGTTLPVGAVFLLPIGLGLGTLYHWTHADGHDPVLAAKSWWLNLPFFVGRSLVYLAVWAFLAFRLWRGSVAQDVDGDPSHTRSNVRWSVGFLLLFAPTFSAAAFDWLMSLDPHWASTMFALYQFSGAFVSGLALLLVVVVLLRRAGRLPNVGVAHLHDLGRLLFGFSSFWAYLWFCQLMLIWYANIPEETGWYLRQWHGGWGLVSIIVPVLLWVIPFFGLMRRESKRNESTLLHVAACVLVGRWLDLGLNIFAALDLPLWIGPAEVGATVLAVVALVLAVRNRLAHAPLVPKGDPRLPQGSAHHVGIAM
ncbi:MAG: hypothetical protein IT379_28730 [Deltaproteobacteria bacterium]|nr:hypothetical protein [Deltaproteobacteria bacterium]